MTRGPKRRSRALRMGFNASNGTPCADLHPEPEQDRPPRRRPRYALPIRAKTNHPPTHPPQARSGTLGPTSLDACSENPADCAAGRLTQTLPSPPDRRAGPGRTRRVPWGSVPLPTDRESPLDMSQAERRSAQPVPPQRKRHIPDWRRVGLLRSTRRASDASHRRSYRHCLGGGTERRTGHLLSCVA
jgi:hypothetical protein